MSMHPTVPPRRTYTQLKQRNQNALSRCRCRLNDVRFDINGRFRGGLRVSRSVEDLGHCRCTDDPFAVPIWIGRLAGEARGKDYCVRRVIRLHRMEFDPR